MCFKMDEMSPDVGRWVIPDIDDYNALCLKYRKICYDICCLVLVTSDLTRMIL